MNLDWLLPSRAAARRTRAKRSSDSVMVTFFMKEPQPRGFRKGCHARPYLPSLCDAVKGEKGHVLRRGADHEARAPPSGFTSVKPCASRKRWARFWKSSALPPMRAGAKSAQAVFTAPTHSRSALPKSFST